MNCIALLACIIALALTTSAGAVTVSTGPLTLELNAATGKATALTLAGSAKAPAGVTGGFAVADHAGDKSFATFPVAVTAGEGVLRFEGADRGLKLVGAIKVEAHRIDVRGEIADTSGQDRAISLRFALPVANEGLLWSRDLRRRSRIDENMLSTNAINVGVGSGKMELWPLSAINDDSATLSLATRIDEPAIFHCSYDPQESIYAIQFDVALTALATKLPRRAPFHFAILASETPFGMRSALAEYYATWPDLFVKRTNLLGGWFAWGDILHLASPISDFGLMFHEGADSKGHQSDPKLGIPRYPYIEPGMFQLHFGDFDHRPSREEIMKRLGEYAAEADDAEKLQGLAPGDAWNRKMCRAILKSGIRDAGGELVIAAVGQYSWVAGGRWAAQFPLLLDPDIANGAAATYLAEMEQRVPDPDWGEGRYLDSYSAHILSVDYSPEALAVADFPPCFDGELRPCQLMAIPMFEYVEALGKLLDRRNKTILVNAYSHSAPFPFHRFDILGKEHWVSGPGRLFERYRAMAYQKVVTNLPSSEPIDRRFMEGFLLHNVYPGGYGRGNWGQEEMRADYRRVVPLLRLESRLGWEPINWAKASSPEVKVERYGNPPGPVLFAVHNPYAPKEVTLDLDRHGYGSGDLQCLDILGGRPLIWSSDENGLQVKVGLGVQDTALIAAGDRAAFGALYRMLAADKLSDVKLCLREWPLREDDEHPGAEKLRAICEAGPSGPEATASVVPSRGWAGMTKDAAMLMLLEVEHPLNSRMYELLTRAADLVEKADDPPDLKPAERIVVPEGGGVGAKLPWVERFDVLSAERWRVEDEHRGIEIQEGKLTMTLPPGKKSVAITSQEAFDFGTRPLEIRYRFQFNHGGHQWYLMQTLALNPTASGGDDYLSIRCDPGLQMRVENGETAASGYQKSLTSYQSYETNVPHEVSLTIDGYRYRLLIDGELHGEGAHDLTFASGYISLGLYSGHGGHGDVCWFDDIEVSETTWEK